MPANDIVSQTGYHPKQSTGFTGVRGLNRLRTSSDRRNEESGTRREIK